MMIKTKELFRATVLLALVAVAAGCQDQYRCDCEDCFHGLPPLYSVNPKAGLIMTQS